MRLRLAIAIIAVLAVFLVAAASVNLAGLTKGKAELGKNIEAFVRAPLGFLSDFLKSNVTTNKTTNVTNASRG